MLSMLAHATGHLHGHGEMSAPAFVLLIVGAYLACLAWEKR